MITPLDQKHQLILGKEVTSNQRYFYELFPKYRGISDTFLNFELLEAVFIAAFTFGTVHDRVLFLVPMSHEKWVLDQFNKIADTIFQECANSKHPTHLAKGYGALFNRIGLTGQVQLLEEPSRWVAFGFSKNDVPNWMASRLFIKPK
jgi:hypothetical protein